MICVGILTSAAEWQSLPIQGNALKGLLNERKEKKRASSSTQL
jgi:hypothetical protein